MNDMTSNSVNRSRLFWGICIALLPTAFSFVLVSNILNPLKTEFILTNAQVGYIGGAALWGMAVSLLTIGPFLEKIGFRKSAIGAFLWVAPFGFIVAAAFLIVYLNDKKKGGYKAERLEKQATET